MNLIYGLILIGVAIVMLIFGRPGKGMDVAPFLKAWIVGQMYVIATLIAFVMGTSLVVMSLPD